MTVVDWRNCLWKLALTCLQMMQNLVLQEGDVVKVQLPEPWHRDAASTHSMRCSADLRPQRLSHNRRNVTCRCAMCRYQRAHMSSCSRIPRTSSTSPTQRRCWKLRCVGELSRLITCMHGILNTHLTLHQEQVLSCLASPMHQVHMPDSRRCHLCILQQPQVLHRCGGG